jgi:hypothetical protein
MGHALPSDPGSSALVFLEKVREGEINLEPGGDTALTAQTAPEKKDVIAKRLKRLAEDLGQSPLEVGTVQLDENFAAVLVRKTGGYDPSRLQVFSVAMVKREARWLAAPLPSSFENSGAGYTLALRKKLKSLEAWMLREQVAELGKLQTEAAVAMRQKIEVNLTTQQLRDLNAGQVVAKFLSACEKRDLPAVLGLLGGLQTTLPSDWPARLKAADQALGSTPTEGAPWRLLVGEDVLRVAVLRDQAANRCGFTIVCLRPTDPARGGKDSNFFSGIRLELVKSAAGLWQVNLPGNFFATGEDVATATDASLSADLPDLFVKAWREGQPASPQASAPLARQALISALAQNNPRALLELTQFPTDPKAVAATCVEVSRVWWLFHAPRIFRQAIPLEAKFGESTALAMMQVFDAREADHFEPRSFYFEKNGAGWLWNPAPAAEVLAEYKAWAAEASKDGSTKWRETLFAESELLEKLPIAPLPTKEEARTCVETWLSMIAQEDFAAALRLVVRLGDPASNSLVLRNLGYDFTNARQNDSPPEITEIYQGKFWTLAGVKIRRLGKSTYPLYLVIQTPQGPRILAETDIFAAGNRGREFVNRASIEHLTNYTSAEALTELTELTAAYQETALDRPSN